MNALLEIKNLKVHFGSHKDPLRAVDGVDLEVGRGESVGLVGESGCGKTTLGRAILRLEQAQAGEIRYGGGDVLGFNAVEQKAFREQAQMIFQDPYGSLNPRITVGGALDEVLLVHGYGSKEERRERAVEIFRSVGLDPMYLDRYPHEFSGGQRQRIGIARALAVGPNLIIADEPVSALDVSVQVQILNLLKDLQQEYGLSYLFVAHDLAVVRYVTSRLYVMYLGKIVETGSAETVYGKPAHPYTEALLSAVPDVQRALHGGASEGERIILRGDVPSATKVIPGCPFHPRCHRVQAKCKTDIPVLREVGEGRKSACHFAEDLLTS